MRLQQFAEKEMLQPVDLLYGLYPDRQIVYNYTRDSRIYSETHRYLPKKESWEEGGPFFVRHETYDVVPTIPITAEYPGFKGAAHMIPNGGFLLSKPPPVALPLFADEQKTLRFHGASGWAKARPGNPLVHSLAFLKELERLPTIPLALLSKAQSFKNMGSEYLNVQFGWVPFLKDLKKMHEITVKLDKLLAELRANNGKGVRRRRTVTHSDTTTATTLYDGPTITGAFYNNLGNGLGFRDGKYTLVKYERESERVWFHARFRYWVKNIASVAWERRAIAALYGGIPTPGEIWEAMPWSWLIDWFSNAGDVLANLSVNAVDNLVADYAFVMRQHTVATEYHAIGEWPAFSYPGLYQIPAGKVASVARHIVTTKSRDAATPYGFDIKWEDLSPYRLSILAALGMSRSRF